MHDLLLKKAKEHAKNMFHIYLEQRDFEKVIDTLHPDITWIGTGQHEVCKNFEDATKLLRRECDTWDGRYVVLDEWYKAVSIDETKCMIFGEIKFTEEGKNIFSLDMHTRFSIIAYYEDDSFKLYHIHFSVPNAAQNENMFVPREIANNYNLILEKELEQRTHMLEEKTRELEAITNNIAGGIEVCQFDDDWTIQYLNEGFCNLTGYTKAEIKSLFDNKHMCLIYPADVEGVRKELLQYSLGSKQFSLEYRIVKKDETIIWVLDNGTVCYNSDGEPTSLQSVLTDITKQKNQEEQLRITEKRHQIALRQTDLSMFEYDIQTKKLILFEKDASLYDVPTILDDGPETLIKMGAIMSDCVEDYREMYRKIHACEPFANCFINTKDTDNIIHDYELSLTTIFSTEGVPISAIGIKKDVSQIHQLQREKKYGQTILDNRQLLFEADITDNILIYVSPSWEYNEVFSTAELFSDMIVKVADRFVVDEYKFAFLNCFSPKYLAEEYEKGNRLITLQYKRYMKKHDSRWFECAINIIRDDKNDHLSIRMYHTDITDRKIKEQNAEREKLLYESMVAKAILSYEVDITKNAFVKGHENWNRLYGVQVKGSFSQMIREFTYKCVMVDDRDGFLHMMNRKNLLNNYEKGNNRLSSQYRRTDSRGITMWVECVLHLYEDPETGDIRGYAYVEDIDSKKRNEIELKYRADHDVMTELLNKDTTAYVIEQYLGSDDAFGKKHALLVADIDKFKDINDTFGHRFGDSVIIQLAEKIKSVCGETSNIIGRIGGDEFCVFIKDINCEDEAVYVAETLCKALLHNYETDDKIITISASIGISIYPENGSSYEKMFLHADKALYAAKNKGRNQYSK